MDESRLDIFKKDLERFVDRQAIAVAGFVRRVRQEIVLPFCSEHDYTFVSGMGTYFFVDKDDQNISVEYSVNLDPEMELIFKALDAEIVGRFSVGEFMNDITREDVEEFRNA